jgi:hypothetical protein
VADQALLSNEKMEKNQAGGKKISMQGARIILPFSI